MLLIQLCELGGVFLLSILVISCGRGIGSYGNINNSNAHGSQEYAGLIEFPAEKNPDCPDWRPGQTVLIKKSITLPENCRYEKVSIRISRSNVKFDCAGAVFNGLSELTRHPYGQAYKENMKPRYHAFIVAADQEEGGRLSDITISNCQVLNYVNSVSVMLRLSADIRSELRQGRLDEQGLRDKAPKNVRVVNSKLLNSHKHGVFIHPYVTYFELRNSIISGSGNSGLYLEAGSRFALIVNNEFTGNGYSSYNNQDYVRTERVSNLSRREAIAVDSSSFNTIAGNLFSQNADGGVYLYKNCWEHADNTMQVPRVEGANANKILNNRFFMEEVGVWVAERADRDLSGFKCGDPLFYRWWYKKYYRDFARNNYIAANDFDSVGVGIKIQDSGNTIVGNRFKNTLKGRDIEIGSWVRNKLADSVKNTVLKDNQFSSKDAVKMIGIAE